MYEYYRRVGYWEMNALYWMKILTWCAVKTSVTPLETCLLYGMIDLELIPMGYARYVGSSFGHLLVHLDSYVLVVFM